MSQKMHWLLIQCLCEIGFEWKVSLRKTAEFLSLLWNETLSN